MSEEICYDRVQEVSDMDWVRIIQKAIDDIEAELCGDISADVIAEKHHVSSYYFQKMFLVLMPLKGSVSYFNLIKF